MRLVYRIKFKIQDKGVEIDIIVCNFIYTCEQEYEGRIEGENCKYVYCDGFRTCMVWY